MYEAKHQRIVNQRVFIRRVTRNFILGLAIILFSVLLGMLGYHYLANLPWIDSFENAAMILSGMGPVDVLDNSVAKVFAGCYALFSGVVFLVVIAIIFAPVVHRFFHKFHLADSIPK
jgi:hypothetical protein